MGELGARASQNSKNDSKLSYCGRCIPLLPTGKQGKTTPLRVLAPANTDGHLTTGSVNHGHLNEIPPGVADRSDRVPAVLSALASRQRRVGRFAVGFTQDWEGESRDTGSN